MKNYRWLAMLGGCVVVCLVLAVIVSSPLGANSIERAALENEQLEAIVKPGVHTCTATGTASRTSPDNVIPSANASEFSAERVARTLNGVWRGGVVGDDVGIDYFWIVDVPRGLGMVLAQRRGPTAPAIGSPLENPPKISYLMCPQGDAPAASKPQINVFTKISHDLDSVVSLVEKAAGVTFPPKPTLEDLWDAVVAIQYFDTLKEVPFGGGFFKSIEITTVPGERGTSEVSLSWDGEYLGAGMGAPLVGAESARFVGTSTTSGDFLVASPGNGDPWTMKVADGGADDVAFDSTTIGPLVQ